MAAGVLAHPQGLNFLLSNEAEPGGEEGVIGAARYMLYMHKQKVKSCGNWVRDMVVKNIYINLMFIWFYFFFPLKNQQFNFFNIYLQKKINSKALNKILFSLKLTRLKPVKLSLLGSEINF